VSEVGAKSRPRAVEVPPPKPAPDPAAVADFLRSLAHDLRSPLGVVTEALAALRGDFAEQMTDDHRLLGSLADRGLKRIGHIADQISLAAALEAGTFVLRRSQVDLVALLRAAIATAASIEPRREVTVTAELRSEPCPVLVDSERLARAVCEILINATRHARRSVRLGLEVAPGEARVVVEDDGQGIPAERHATLFQRFAPRPSRSGLGLGLSIAQEVVAAHGGRLTLEASTLPPGRAGTTGARLILVLPLPS
jgi:signal transduction histidine kinase